MCGIYGTTIPYNKEEIHKKLIRTNFRGPDKLDYKFMDSSNGKVILGHNRLSIIDLDPRSNQPFNYQDAVEIVFNGEIFNFQSLKSTLERAGYTFRTTSDTEVICAAYLEYGENCVTHFNGMFAFVIYDIKEQIFFGARDRLGQKPFYYYHRGTAFEFASQISSIQLGNEKLTISRKSILEYLKWGAIPEPDSIFNEVKKLRAGHSFTFNLTSGDFRDHKYWDIDYSSKNPFEGTYEEAKDKLEETLKDAVKIRLFADVPVGVFLSGGIDSSLISAYATQVTSTKVKTFSVKFNEKGYDESRYAQMVADHLQTDHHVIECNYEEGLDLIDTYSHYYDEPFADPSAIPSLLLSKHTRKEVTVALSGDAGDEMFIGYHRYAWMKKAENAYAVPSAIRKSAAALLLTIPNYRIKNLGNILKYENPEQLYLANLVGVNQNWLDDELDFNSLQGREYIFHQHKNLYERISDFDQKQYLNWDINTKVDRASMAYSLEARSPIMDYRVVALANAFPTEFKYHGKQQKRILKDLLYRHVPRSFFERPKAGFTMPFETWFRNELKEYVLSELDDMGLKEIPGVHANILIPMIDQHMEGKWNHYPLIWKLLVLKQWLNKNGKGISIK